MHYLSSIGCVAVLVSLEDIGGGAAVATVIRISALSTRFLTVAFSTRAAARRQSSAERPFFPRHESERHSSPDAVLRSRWTVDGRSRSS
jgi:hypothetical protein